MTQPEALRLAHELQTGHPLEPDAKQAAAELRRLSAAEAQRNALLEALKYLDKEFRQHGRQHWPEAVRVRAAIKSVEEGK